MYPQSYPHDEIVSLYPGVYFLHGSIKMGPGMRMNRNMVILKSGQELTLINPVRMVSAQTTPPKTHAEIPLNCLQII